MPTSDDYTEAAARFRNLASRLEAARFPGASAAFGEGPVGVSLDAQMTTVAADVVTAAEECRRLASTCDTRATVCDEYRRAMIRFWLDSLDGQPLVRPVRPAPWVEL